MDTETAIRVSVVGDATAEGRDTTVTSIGLFFSFVGVILGDAPFPVDALGSTDGRAGDLFLVDLSRFVVVIVVVGSCRRQIVARMSLGSAKGTR